ncbi:hypothetical protein HBI81_134610 [Parastagonospora nodorum]|nr:hypothetical protein HBH49_103510 [Parastagonospora nodorum]KAH4159475.1 hypothetical protein HBH44_104720 [Parastagonospora nodorum]KAH4189826.1 hypothetical protein HBH42_136320 [Parastagonospora nodorum]KAH4603007.1 hypothetical protein HBH82_154610 [Parastagonospora nodorum]KAH4850162.1 hypothetical protein HBH75_136590 [Parastagonospora nodorum]
MAQSLFSPITCAISQLTRNHTIGIARASGTIASKLWTATSTLTSHSARIRASRLSVAGAAPTVANNPPTESISKLSADL